MVERAKGQNLDEIRSTKGHGEVKGGHVCVETW